MQNGEREVTVIGCLIAFYLFIIAAVLMEDEHYKLGLSLFLGACFLVYICYQGTPPRQQKRIGFLQSMLNETPSRLNPMEKELLEELQKEGDL